jgi:hypothetical protein
MPKPCEPLQGWGLRLPVVTLGVYLPMLLLPLSTLVRVGQQRLRDQCPGCCNRGATTALRYGLARRGTQALARGWISSRTEARRSRSTSRS